MYFIIKVIKYSKTDPNFEDTRIINKTKFIFLYKFTNLCRKICCLLFNFQ